MFDNQNLWVFKPNDCNRGRGVHIFSKLDDLKKLISEFVLGSELPAASKKLQPQFNLQESSVNSCEVPMEKRLTN